MIRNCSVLLKILIAAWVLLPVLVFADQRFVTDQFEITMRSGPTNSHTIVRMLKSGTALTVLE